MGDDSVVDEVRVLHADLAEWLGTAGATAALERFVGQLDGEFSMVTLEGQIARYEELSAGLRGAGNAAPGVAIEITDIEVLHRTGDGVVVRFKEIHRSAGAEAARWTTAVLVADAAGRNGLRWRSVHETAID
ncbi:hypothetical protein [Nocardia sp. NPDC056100]|uniref:hypothetical protein n=1 Tax=Nocardia sp. NPDC056100 TaxID=3345712 RepID=UPI0035E02527